MGNQYLRDDTLFTSPRGQKITTLGIRGDKLALYTEDNAIYQRFKKWEQRLFTQDYRQGDIHGPLVAVDLYFPLSAKKQLLRALQPTVSNKGGV